MTDDRRRKQKTFSPYRRRGEIIRVLIILAIILIAAGLRLAGVW